MSSGLNSAVERRLSEGLAGVEGERNSEEQTNLIPIMICGIIGPEIVDLGGQILFGVGLRRGLEYFCTPRPNILAKHA